MIDLKKVREDIAGYKKICKHKGKNIDVDGILAKDDERKQLQLQIDGLKHQQKELGTKKDYEGAKNLKAEIQGLEKRYETVVVELDKDLLTMPNTALHPDVPIGKDETENVVTKTFGEIPKFDFEFKDHMTLMKLHDMVDVDRGVKLAGARSYFLKGDGMMLEQAVLQYTLHKLVTKGFTPMNVPNIVNPECLVGTGYFPGGEEDAYRMERDNQRLIGTSEIPVTAYHMDEILTEDGLPKKYCGYSACYRREAGTYGKDTAGLFRVHQFMKVEQVVILPENEKMSNEYHTQILQNAMDILDDLKIPYHVLQLCSGDLAIGKYNSHDLECWMPSRNAYGETHSVTSFLDFQARRLNLRYRDSEGKIKYCYTMNNTAIATPRILIAIIENNQQKDGTIKIPEVLVPYMGKKYIGDAKKVGNFMKTL
ncbi:MAG: serine--tRNA ligase [candidate division SR1 bacterium CG_4_9_14_3_um_filter_40_9]|nr:MAG: serine--tRNA ligase [candidate division SR1 bacterium CG_4_9_14_3_um_filter_40_9]